MTLTQVSSRGVEDTLRWSLGASGTDHYTFTGPGLTGTVNDPTIYLTRGQTYIFENNSGGHPFQIQSTAGSGGSAYNTGVTNNGGGNGTEIKITVPHDSPDILYYQCTSHANMGGQFNIAGSVADGSISTAKIADDAVDADKLANSINTAIAANTAKTTNATHTGDVTGSTSLTIANDAVTTAKIADDAVTSAKIGANQVTTTEITVAGVQTVNIADDAVTFAKMQNTANGVRLLGKHDSGGGQIGEITAAQARTMLNVADGATAGGGKVVNYAQTFKTDFFSEIVGANSDSSDAISLSYAAANSSNKLLITTSLTVSGQEIGFIYAKLFIGGSVSAAIGNVNSSRSRVTACGRNDDGGGNFTFSHTYLHSSPSTSSTTYSYRLSHSAPVNKYCILNATYSGADNYRVASGTSSITILELTP